MAALYPRDALSSAALGDGANPMGAGQCRDFSFFAQALAGYCAMALLLRAVASTGLRACGWWGGASAGLAAAIALRRCRPLRHSV